MRSPRILFLLVWLACVGLPVPAQARGAAELVPAETGFTFAELGQKDIKITVINEQEFIDFPLPSGRNIRQAVLNLHIQHSTELLPTLSDIVIAVNDEPVSDVLLTQDNASDAVLPVPLPVEVLKPGDNELLLRFSQRLRQNGCGDVGDRDLWVKVLADSSLRFTWEETREANDLAQFPLPYSSFAALPGSPQVSILLPSGPSPAELSAAAQLAASLGQAANWKTPPLAASTVDQAGRQPPAADALVVVDTAGRNPLARSSAPGLSALPSPYDANQLMLVVSGADDAGLLRSVSMLTMRSARGRLTGSHMDPTDMSPKPAEDRPAQSKFSELGLTTKRVRGIGRHDLYYPIDVPYDWKTTSEAAVDVRFQHGRAVTSASLMTAYINGFETASIRLDARNAEDGRLVIRLSPRQIHPGRNWLHLVFDLHMTRENCKYRYFEEAWAEISAENSLVNLAHVVSIAPLDLRYTPAYLVVPDDLSSDLFVLPAAPTSADLTAMVRIAAKLGTYSQSDAVRLRATTADRFAPSEEMGNVIAIGSPENNILIGKYVSQLPQPLSTINGRPPPSAGRDLLPEEQAGQAAYLEVTRSPWARSGSLLVLGAHSQDLLLRMVDILPAGGRTMNLQGNVAVVTADSVAAFQLGGLAGVSISPTARRMIAVILITAFALLASVGGALVYLRRGAHRQEKDD